jgi:hypothetical protein
MPTIDLGAATSPASPTSPTETWADLPRRVGLTLPELRLLAETITAPLPFDLLAATPAPDGGGLSARLGLGAGATQDQAYAEVLARLGDPADSLQRRGLLASESVFENPASSAAPGGAEPALPSSRTRSEVDPGIAGALGVLASPSLALDLDVAVDGQRAHAWHRYRDGAVATLATGDGLVFELAWFAATAWPEELARVAALPEETRLRSSLVPTALRVPWHVADAAAEAVRSGRPELVPVIAGDATTGTVLTALAGEAHGRLRALVSTVAEEPHPVGVAAWTLLADGWHALRAHRSTDETDDLVEIVRVDAGDLAAELAPLLAEVA